MKNIMQGRKALIRRAGEKARAASNIMKGMAVATDPGRNLCLWLKKRQNPLFVSVEIETTSICNRKCLYCPNSVAERPAGNIPDELFTKIIDELAEMNYSGRLSPHLYGEPLVDKRIVRFIAYARERLPGAFIKLFTNGDLLTFELLNELDAAGVDVFRVSQHDKQADSRLIDILQRYTGIAGKHKVEYMKYFDNDENLMNRGGLIAVRHDVNMKFCTYVSGITIDFEGNMLLCCQDYLAKHKLGNLKDENIMDVWNKDSYKSLRDRIESGMWLTALCRVCNGRESGNGGNNSSAGQ